MVAAPIPIVTRRMAAAQLVLAAPPNPADPNFMEVRAYIGMAAMGMALSAKTQKRVAFYLDAVAGQFGWDVSL